MKIKAGIHFTSILFLCAGLVSCRESLCVPERADLLLCVAPEQSGAKSAVDGAVMPDTYTVHLTSRLYDADNGTNNQDYFVDRAFRHDGLYWRSNPRSYWPFSGCLRFLSLCCEDSCIDLSSCARWADNNASAGVDVTVPDEALLDSELMFSAADAGKDGGRGVMDMRFLHSQSWLHFRMKSDIDNLVRVDRIEVMKAYRGGTFRVRNEDVLEAWWDFGLYGTADVTVPGTEGRVLHTDYGTADILLPEQEACEIVFHLTQKGEPSDPWTDDPHEFTLRVPADGTLWSRGVKRIYDLDMRSGQIVIDVTLAAWDSVTHHPVLPQ